MLAYGDLLRLAQGGHLQGAGLALWRCVPLDLVSLVRWLHGAVEPERAPEPTGGRRSGARGTQTCRYVSQPMYFENASETAGAYCERLNATWCSKPFSQM